MYNNLINTSLHKALLNHTACIFFTPEGVIKHASQSFLDVIEYFAMLPKRSGLNISSFGNH